MKHTKGPWKYEDESSSGYTWYNIRSNGLLIGSVESNQQDILHNITIEETKQNALLISKSPEMLEALETIRDAFWSEDESAQEQVEDLKSIAIKILKELE